MSGGSFDAIITNGMASIRSSAGAAAESVGKLATGMTKVGEVGEKQFKRVGEAIAKMGGPLGGIGGRLFGAAGMEGGFARLAAAAALAGLAIKALSGVMEAAQARAEAFAKAADGLRGAARSAASARASFAIGSEGTGRKLAAAESVYGSFAGDDAKELAQKYGAKLEDVYGVMSGSRGIPKAQRRASIEAALAAGSTGLMDSSSAIAAMADRGTRTRALSARGGDYADGLTPEEMAGASLLSMHGGLPGPAGMTEAQAAIIRGRGYGPASSRIAGVNAGHNIATGGQVDAFTSGATETAVRGSAAAAVSPEAAALTDFHNALQASQARFADLLAATPKLIQVIDRITSPINNATDAARREVIGSSAALNGGF